MASFVDDVARIRDVLQANAVDKVVDEGIINALLELYATDNQRVDLVLLDLEGMLGKTLSVGISGIAIALVRDHALGLVKTTYLLRRSNIVCISRILILFPLFL